MLGLTLAASASVTGGGLVLLGLTALAWWQRRRRQADERLAEIARASMSRDRYPSMYVGPDTPFGLRSGTPCRVRAHKASNVVEIVTPEGFPWNVRGALVVRRTGRDAPPAPPPRPGKRQRAPRREVYR